MACGLHYILLMNALQDPARPKIDISIELDSGLNFPTIYLMAHWAKQIHPYGGLLQYSPVRHEQQQKTKM